MRCRPGSIAPAGFLCRITLPGTLTVGGLAIVGNFAGTRNRETAPSIARIRGFPGQPGGALLHDAGPRFSRDSGCGRIAQLVEQLTLNQRVQGSSPCAPTSRVKGLMEKIKDRWFPEMTFGKHVGNSGPTAPAACVRRMSVMREITSCDYENNRPGLAAR